MFDARTPAPVPGQFPLASTCHVAPRSVDFAMLVYDAMYQAPFCAWVAEKLPCMCSRGLTFDQAVALIVPSRYFAPAVPPTRPAVVVRQIPFRPLLSCAMTHQVVALIGIT